MADILTIPAHFAVHSLLFLFFDTATLAPIVRGAQGCEQAGMTSSEHKYVNINSLADIGIRNNRGSAQPIALAAVAGNTA